MKSCSCSLLTPGLMVIAAANLASVFIMYQPELMNRRHMYGEVITKQFVFS